jgi:serine protease AprX
VPRAGLVALCASALAAVASAQVPSNLSPRLAALAARPDTSALVWVVARPHADLAALAARVAAAGGRVRSSSRFLSAVSATVPSAALADLARLPGVRRVQPVGVWVRPADETCGRPDSTACLAAAARPQTLAPAAVPGGASADTLYGAGGWAARQMNVPALHALGLRGAGVRVALLDAGFNTLHPMMAGATVVAQRDFVGGDSIVRDQPGDVPAAQMSHGTATWSLIAANAPGRLFGEATLARFLLAKTEYVGSETRIEEDHWVAAVEWADSIGVDIISSSLGYLDFDGGFSYTYAQLNGDIAVTSVAADSAAKRGILVVVSVGNSGPGLRTLGTPADADSIVAVGATDSLGRLASFSSRGPTADGRHKPEVVAPGVSVTFAAMDSGLARGNGTSFSAPLIAGLAALVQGTRLGRPAVELRLGLLAAASNRATPNDSTGWGVPDALKFLAFPTGLMPRGPSDTLLATLTPTFDWVAEQPSGFAPDTFRLRVATDTGFTRVLLDTVTTASAVTLPFGARPGARLFWRLDARSPLGVGDSTARRGPFTVPEWATLLTFASPGGGSTRDSMPRLAWHAPDVAASAGPIRFDVAVYPASGSPAQAVASAAGLTDTTYAVPRPLEHNLPFRWRVVVHVGVDSAIVTSAGSFVVLDNAAPATTLLFQNFPNPFPNPTTGLTATCIWFDVAQGGDVRLEVFDLRGRLVRRIAPGPEIPATLDPGHYGRPPGDVPGSCDTRFAWDGRDETGAYVRQGVYLYRLVAPGFRDAKRIVFLGAP